MATAAQDAAGDDPQRPYTIGTFQTKLDRFQELIRVITYQGAEASPEERRQWITGELRPARCCVDTTPVKSTLTLSLP